MKRLMILIAALVILLSGCKSGIEYDVLWTNFNGAAVESSPENPTVIVLEKDCVITAISNYHYFNNGVLPGSITLVGVDGTKYGPWQAKGRVGQGGVQNATWDVLLKEKLKAGKYEVMDSSIETWSQNGETGFSGMTEVRGYYK